jgi:chromosome segregation ATPase
MKGGHAPMIRKLLFVSAGLVLVGLFVFGRHAASYVGTGAGWVRDTVKDSVPLDFEIDRARNMVGSLEPEIKKNMHVIAKEEAEVERLQQRIDQAAEKLDKDTFELKVLKNDVASGKESFKYSGRIYTVSQVKTDLANRLERVKTADATIDSLRDILNARQQGLEAGRQKLEAMLNTKQQLLAKIEHLEAQWKQVEVAKAASEFSFDDSKLGIVRQLVDDLQTRIQVAEKLVTVEGSFHGEIQLDSPADEDIVDQVAQYLGESESEIHVAEVSTTTKE